MNLRRIKHTLLRMTAEEKVVGIGSIVILLSTFMPWYSVVMNFDKKSMTETGFSGDLGVIGFVIFLMAIITIIVLIAENMRLPLPQFGYERDQIIFFLLGQSFFLTLLTMAVYTKRGLEFTDASLRFGIYTVLIASFFGALSAFALIQKGKREEVEEFFQHTPQDGTDSDLNEITNNDTKEVEDYIKPEPMFFEEDAEAMPDPSPEILEKKEEEFNEYISEDDIIEDIQDIPSKEINNNQVDDSPKVQNDYLRRDAGISKIEEAHEAEKKAKTDNSRLGISFYEDK